MSDYPKHITVEVANAADEARWLPAPVIVPAPVVAEPILKETTPDAPKAKGRKKT